MLHPDIIRAWKDEDYRLSLSEAERTALPAHPAGLIELVDSDLDAVAGGRPFDTKSGDISICKPTNQSPCPTRRDCDPLIIMPGMV
jgi:mersacidin/lichenicidin family type 2 lantibiotic